MQMLSHECIQWQIKNKNFRFCMHIHYNQRTNNLQIFVSFTINDLIFSIFLNSHSEEEYANLCTQFSYILV